MPEMGKKSKARKIASKSGIRKPPGAAQGSEKTNLADALFSGTQQRVLTLLFGQPERSYFASELIELARSGSGGVQRELQRLEASGLVRVTRVGNQKHFQANQESPIFSELRSVVLKTVGLAAPLSSALEPLKKRIALALVYGSIAKGTDTASSDVDLLVVADDMTLEELYTAIAPVERVLARRINPTLYTREEFQRRRRIDDSFVSKVLAGEHIVLTGNEHVAAAG
jgi:predicted nucleotidyltransferase